MFVKYCCEGTLASFIPTQHLHMSLSLPSYNRLVMSLSLRINVEPWIDTSAQQKYHTLQNHRFKSWVGLAANTSSGSACMKDVFDTCQDHASGA